jgi:hypothetical protein
MKDSYCFSSYNNTVYIRAQVKTHKASQDQLLTSSSGNDEDVSSITQDLLLRKSLYLEI